MIWWSLSIIITHSFLDKDQTAIRHYFLKPGFHIIAPDATIAAVVEKRVSATVAIYGNTLFSDSSDKYDSGDERRWDRKILISATLTTAATVVATVECFPEYISQSENIR